MILIDGKELAKKVRAELKKKIEKENITPKLAVVFLRKQ